MTREDYIIRHIQQAGQVWAQIVRLIKDGQLPAARTTIDQSYQQLLGLSPNMARDYAAHELIARLRFDESEAAGRDKCIALATLLKASADLAAAHGDTDAQISAYHKALVVLLDVMLRDPATVLPAYAPTVEALDAELSGYAMPLTTRALLLRYYEQVGGYAKAEDELFAMLNAAPGDPQVIEAGRALYARLQRHSDAELDAGNLSREEVASGLAELEAHAREHRR